MNKHNDMKQTHNPNNTNEGVPFTVGVHKRNVLPQNHCQDITLNEDYIYKIIYLVDFLVH
jgi:hypothetical protein